MAMSFLAFSVYSPRPLVYVTEQDVVLVDGYPLQYSVQGRELTLALVYVIVNLNNPLCSAGIHSSHGQPLSSGSLWCHPSCNASLSAGCVNVDEYNELTYRPTFTTTYLKERSTKPYIRTLDVGLCTTSGTRIYLCCALR